MTIQQIIKQTETLNRQDFLRYLQKLQKIANEKFSMNIFLQNTAKQAETLPKEELLPQNNELLTRRRKDSDKNNITQKRKKRKLKHVGSIDLNGSLDEVNIREYAYE